MFHLLKVLIINALCYENETWDKKRLKVNIMYARVRNDSSPAGNASPPGEDASPPSEGASPPKWGRFSSASIIYTRMK